MAEIQKQGASAPPQGAKAPEVESYHRKRGDAQLLSLDESTMDPAFHYRWVRARPDEGMIAVSRAKLKGYKPVHVSEGVKTHVEPDKRPDGVLGIGDLILMKIPKQHYVERVAEKRVKREQMLASTSADTEEMAKQKGVVAVKDPDHNRVVEKPTP